ncbi:MAG TPA: hypothetical protein VM204_02790 [Gaiellaceae bacterium]|nr:hypothetical protein [Gaiellaceae bacterium]
MTPQRAPWLRRSSSASKETLALGLLLAIGCGGAPPASPPAALAPSAPGALRAPSEFAGIADPRARSAAIFVEASRVLLHPRCVSCHPAGDAPLQGDAATLHDPPVVRGDADEGAPGLECTSCHQDRNLELARVPGAPGWHLAPRSMAWQGRSPRTLCEQLKDPARNGGKSLEAIVEHAGHDPLVAWGWRPGHGRTPAPGSQGAFGALIGAWVEHGAACPSEERRP